MKGNLILGDEPGWQSVLWAQPEKMIRRLEQQIGPDARVLEIGLDRPLAATDGHPRQPNTTYLDICQEKLPFADKEFDFVYCRHVIEDLWNPFQPLREIERVGQAGYIETPSPIAELCRGVDGRKALHRGCHHHRWIIWEEDGVLQIVEKSVVAEHVHILDFRESILQTPSIANTYYPWSRAVRFKHWQHDHEFNLAVDFDKVLDRAVNRSLQSWAKLSL